MNYEDLSAELQDKIKSCKTSEEIVILAKEQGYELSDEELEAVSGGIWSCHKYSCSNDGEVVE